MKKFKKLTALLLSGIMVVSMSACGSGGETAATDSSGTAEGTEQSSEAERYAVIMGINQIEFFDALKAGGLRCCNGIGSQLVLFWVTGFVS